MDRSARFELLSHIQRRRRDTKAGLAPRSHGADKVFKTCVAEFLQLIAKSALTHFSQLHSHLKIFSLAFRFVPCLWNNAGCHEVVEGMIADRSWPNWMAGHHKNAGSWFKAAGFSRNLPWYQHMVWRIAAFLLIMGLFCRLWYRSRHRRLPQNSCQGTAHSWCGAKCA